MAKQILLDLPRKVEVVDEEDDAHDKGPNVPLEDFLISAV